MIIIRRRLIFWLVKAYIKRWRNSILSFFGIGLLVFFIFNFVLGSFLGKLSFSQNESIGIVGAYTIDDLPSEILYKISRGLTSVAPDGTVTPDIAYKWVRGNNGKTYVFYLKDNIYFSDGENLTSDLVHYGFEDVSTLRPNKYTIVFTLKTNYAPFLLTVSRPIFKKGFVGIGEYKIKNIKLNGNFVESLDLVSTIKHKTISYKFYPTVSSVKIAFSLGEISSVTRLNNINFKNTTFNSFNNARVEKNVNYQQLVTLFYNTQDQIISSKTLREALTYTIPNSFSQGQRNIGPFSPLSFASQRTSEYEQDLSHAKILIDKSGEATGSSRLSLTIDTLPEYKKIADELSDIWNHLDINTNVKVVDKVPSSFQIFLGEFNVPADPDQYPLWHSDQVNNITNYKNLRIDKLLEDGRQTENIDERKKIYSDFQKFMLSDPPASFLFFPYTYDVIKK